VADPTGGGGNVDVLVNVRAAGLENARAARQAIDEIGRSGQGTTSTLGRLTGAFESMERREPSMALRRSIFALEGMAASAAGASGEFGRLGGAFALLFGGTGIGLAALGTIALLGTAYKALTENTRELEEQHKRTAAAVDEFNKKTAGVAGQARATLSGQGGEVPGFWTLLTGGGEHTGEGLNERLVAQQAAVSKFNAELTRQFGDVASAPDALKQHLRELTDQAVETARAISTTNAALRQAINDTEARARGEVTAQQAHLATMTALRDARREMEQASVVEQLYAKGITDLKSPEALDAFARMKAGWEGISAAAQAANTAAREHLKFVIEAEAPSRPGVGPMETREVGGRRIPNVAQSLETRAQQGDAGAIATLAQMNRPKDQFGRPIEGPEQPTAMAGAGTAGITPQGQADLDRQAARAAADGQKDHSLALREFVAALPTLTGALTRAAHHDAGAALSGFGGAAATFSRIHGLEALGPVGDVLSAGGGVISTLTGLFGDGRAKFRLVDIESEALSKLKDVVQIPQNVSAVIVSSGASAADTKYQLDRLATKTGVVTIPGNP